ncbi:MAG: hypothetical protein KA158_10140, partial [Leucobacter sp.]|nr:hypothetical protein [Leucobacter sp.]
QRPVWWFTDGAKSGALQAGTVFTPPVTDDGTDGPDTDGPDNGNGNGGKTDTGTGSTPQQGSAKLAATGASDQPALAVTLAALATLLGAGSLALVARKRRRA